MWKMWKTFCRKNGKKPDLSLFIGSAVTSFPHSTYIFLRNRPFFNKTFFFRDLRKSAAFRETLKVFPAFHSARVFRHGQVRNLHEHFAQRPQATRF